MVSKKVSIKTGISQCPRKSFLKLEQSGVEESQYKQWNIVAFSKVIIRTGIQWCLRKSVSKLEYRGVQQSQL